ncbi:MAG: hypothetical protein AB8A35_08650, partial [Prochlorococcus sp.]
KRTCHVSLQSRPCRQKPPSYLSLSSFSPLRRMLKATARTAAARDKAAALTDLDREASSAKLLNHKADRR